MTRSELMKTVRSVYLDAAITTPQNTPGLETFLVFGHDTRLDDLGARIAQFLPGGLEVTVTVRDVVARRTTTLAVAGGDWKVERTADEDAEELHIPPSVRGVVDQVKGEIGYRVRELLKQPPVIHGMDLNKEFFSSAKEQLERELQHASHAGLLAPGALDFTFHKIGDRIEARTTDQRAFCDGLVPVRFDGAIAVDEAADDTVSLQAAGPAAIGAIAERCGVPIGKVVELSDGMAWVSIHNGPMAMDPADLSVAMPVAGDYVSWFPNRLGDGVGFDGLFRAIALEAVWNRGQQPRSFCRYSRRRVVMRPRGIHDEPEPFRIVHRDRLTDKPVSEAIASYDVAAIRQNAARERLRDEVLATVREVPTCEVSGKPVSLQVYCDREIHAGDAIWPDHQITAFWFCDHCAELRTKAIAARCAGECQCGGVIQNDGSVCASCKVRFGLPQTAGR